jgi:hypothetical protein
MKQLEIIIKKNGFIYTQVFKNENGYVYSQEGYGKILAYEAFYHKENNHFNTVSFPGNEAFGVWAWSCHNLDSAIKRISNEAN